MLERMTDDQLIREYQQTRKDCFGHNIFCNNARVYFNEIVEELRNRNITEEPNTFGAMPIRKWS